MIIYVLACIALTLYATLVPKNIHVEGLNYYIGGIGASDSNPGTASLPFATIQKACNNAMAGDIINVRTGIYRETITPTNSGTHGNTRIYQPDGDASIIQNSEVSFSSGKGITLGGNCTANNNLVHDIDYEGSYCRAIAPANGVDGQKITNNSIYSKGRSYVDILNSQNAENGYNHMAYEYGGIEWIPGYINISKKNK